MAITSISRIQNRRGLKSDLPPSLAEGELGWCLDTRELFIGNTQGYGLNSEILTQYSQNDLLINHTFTPNGYKLSSAVGRSLGSKLDDFANAKDFGAIGDGVTDNSPILNGAIANLLANGIQSNRIVIHLSAGIYLINSPILLYPYLSIVGDGADCTTILLGNNAASCMLETADSLGQTGSSIGLNNSVLPMHILISDLTISTNNYITDAIHLVRYKNIRFENVKFLGGYNSGNSNVSASSAAVLSSIGNVVVTSDATFISCRFFNFTYGITANDPIVSTSLERCKFSSNFNSINIGSSPNYNGPIWTTVVQSEFSNITDSAILVGNNSINPGVTSISNFYSNCGVTDNVPVIFWGSNTVINSSIVDTFNNNAVNIVNQGINNLILGSQQNNLPVSTGGNANRTVRNITATGDVQIQQTDNIIIVNKLVGSQTNVILPNSPSIGNNYLIKDGKGDANVNNITILSNTLSIDNSAYYNIDKSYGFATVLYDGAEWRII